MRAREFISEVKAGPVGKRRQDATKGLNTYGDGEHISGDYTAYRLGMAVAGSDGITPPNIDAKSWIGKSKSTHPYTKEEQNMLKHAYAAVGAKYQDLNDGDMRSMEPEDTHTTSPMMGFAGYGEKSKKKK
jgi:hypothetical protein